MARKKKHESHENAERWLLTYSDVVTLLVALFVFLYSISDVNAAKYNAFAQSLREVFGMGKIPASFTSQSGGDGILPHNRALVFIQRQLMEQLREPIEQGQISVETSAEGLVLRLKDKVLFELGQVEVAPGATPILASIAGYLKDVPNRIRVEGHTDNLPVVKGSRFASNWELSAARAANVVKFLIEKCDIQPSRLSLAGYAEYKPLKPNLPRIGNAENRRVEIVIINESKKVDEKKAKEPPAQPDHKPVERAQPQHLSDGLNAPLPTHSPSYADELPRRARDHALP